MAHGGGQSRIGDQRRRVGDVSGAVASERLGEALEGAAGDDVAGADSAGRLLGGDDGVGFGQLLAPALASGFGREQYREVRGSASNPLTWTTLTPVSAARSWKASIVRRTNGISPVRST